MSKTILLCIRSTRESLNVIDAIEMTIKTSVSMVLDLVILRISKLLEETILWITLSWSSSNSSATMSAVDIFLLNQWLLLKNSRLIFWEHGNSSTQCFPRALTWLFGVWPRVNCSTSCSTIENILCSLNTLNSTITWTAWKQVHAGAGWILTMMSVTRPKQSLIHSTKSTLKSLNPQLLRTSISFTTNSLLKTLLNKLKKTAIKATNSSNQ